MGQITINIPQHLNFNFRIVENEAAEEVLVKLRKLVKQANAIEAGEVSDIWTEHTSSADEIADHLRQSWKRKLYNG